MRREFSDLRSVFGASEHSASLSWQDLSFKIGEKEILKKITGLLEPGRLTGVMGPSGSGKTTLLNVLSGRQRTSGKINGQGVSMSGQVKLSGEKMKPADYRLRVAYVYQDSALPPIETPRECLDFSAYLRLPASVGKQDREELVNKMLTSLNLQNCADTIIGSALQKGISGGQQKRTAVGVELISNPKLLFLDEPLSGLDSYNAAELVGTLKDLAQSGVPVLMTLHQPSSELFVKLDQLIVMHQGEVCFQGPAKVLANHFRGLGFHIPLHRNPADAVMFTIQQEQEETVRKIKDQWFESKDFEGLRARMEQSSDRAAGDQDGHRTSSGESSEDETGACVAEPTVIEPRKNCCAALLKLLQRERRASRRQFKLFIWQVFIFKLSIAVLYGCFFFQQGRLADRPSGKPNCRPEDYDAVACTTDFTGHFSALSLVCMTLVIESMNYALVAFHGERAMFLRESAGGYYNVISYFLSKTVIEAGFCVVQCLVFVAGTYWLIGFRAHFYEIFLGTLIISMTSSSMMWCTSTVSKTREQAASLSVLPWTLQFAFSGLLLSIHQIPAFIRWLRWICPLYYGLGFLTDIEFSFLFDGEFTADSPLNATTGLQNATAMQGLPAGVAIRRSFLTQMDIRYSGRWWPYLGMCGVLFVTYRLLALFILWRRSRFVV